jgi:hypothetical protein
MTYFYFRAHWLRSLLFTVAGLSSAGLLTPTGVQAQPTITAVAPAPNARAATRTGPITVTFDQALTAGSAAALKVYSSQRGGLRTRGATPAVVSGNTLSFSPGSLPFLPGETVFSTVTTAAQAAAGGSLARPRVTQFTTAVGGSGRGTFVLDAYPTVGITPTGLAIGDVDGDGDLDMVTANYNSFNVTILLNGGDATGSNTGTFAITSTMPLTSRPDDLVLGDVDGDGDLDLVVSYYDNYSSTALIVRLNGGNATGSNTGSFSGGSTVTAGAGPKTLALADVDGDGDQDLVIGNGTDATVSIRLNGGNATGSNTGTFSNGTTVGVGDITDLVMGDIDGDGDLDLVLPDSPDSTVLIFRNGSDATGSNTGIFGAYTATTLRLPPSRLTLGDIDGDGDLDFLASNYSSNTVTVCLNGGNASGSNTGIFTESVPITGISAPKDLVLGDVDSDGDLDLVVGSAFNFTGTVRLNGGDASGSNTGLFSNGSNLSIASGNRVALGDVDGDGDLDVVAADNYGSFASVSLNGARTNTPAIISFTPTSGPVGTVVTLNGTRLTGTTAVTFGGGAVVTTGFTVNAAGTQITGIVVPSGAQTGVISVTTPGGTATSSGVFTVLSAGPPLLITAVSPTANARAAARTSPVTVTFDQPLTAGSAAALKVYSAQRGGLRTRGTTPAVVSGSSVSFTPSAYAFSPGETVLSTVTTAAQATAGGTLAQPRVQQFTAAVGGTGRGTFVPTSSLAVPNMPAAVAAGDVDGDGDLDLVTANSAASSITVLRNNGSGTYTIAASTTLPERSTALALGDVDGDGDLDVVASSFGGGNGTGTTVSIRLNGGDASGSNTGTFSNGSDVTVGNGPYMVALGDVDGDGDLDFVVSLNGTTSNGTAVRVVLNGGNATGSNTGVFSNGSSVTVGTSPFAVALGDVDNDGDLDLVTAVTDVSGNGSVRVSLNAGTGTYGGGSTVAVLSAAGLALADVNADGYLDILTEASVRLNTANGTGTFGGGSDPAPDFGGYVAAADVDADGDLDMVTGNVNGRSSLSVRLNNGSGTFSGGYDLSLSDQKYYITLADVDGDGDVDVVSANPKDAQSVSILLNAAAPVPTITSFTPTSGPAGTTVTITGTNLTGTSVIAFGGTGANTVTSAFTVNAAGTQITGVVVPTGARTGPISVTAPGGTAISTTNFTVPVPTLTSISPNSGTVGTSITLTGTFLSGATQVSFNGTTTSTFTSNSATQLVLAVPSGATTGPVTVTTPAGTSNAINFTVNCPVATITYSAASYCQTGSSNPTPTLTGATGGSFTSAPGLVLNSTTGVITLASSTPGTYTISYTGGTASCPTTATAQVTITAAPVAIFSYPTATTYCAGSTSTVSPTLGTGASSGTFTSTTGLSLNAATGVITLSTSTAGTYTVTNSIAASGSCAAATATATVTITPGTTATFTYSGTTFCATGTNPTPTVTGTVGGTFSSATGLSLNATTGAINLSASTPGTYTVTYTVAGACGSSATASVTITSGQMATFSYGTATTYCVSGATAPAVVLGTGATGGTFSSTTGLTLNATTGAITLASSTPGTYTVTNTVAAAGGCAAATATATVTITAGQVAMFSYATTAGCAGSATAVTPTLGTGASAGTFSSTTGLVLNATTGAINLATSTAGTYTVTNTVAAAGGCAAVTATATFTVNPRPATPTISVVYNGATTTLTSSATTGNQWYLNGNIITGATGQTYVVNGLPAQYGSYTVTTTNANGCFSLPSTPLVITAARNGIAGASLQVYPNPTPTGQMTLELTGYRLTTQLTVLDALGRVLISELLPANAGTATRTLDLKGVATGVYLLRLRNTDGVETRRLVRE